MNTIIEQLRQAHEAACNVYNILSDITEQMKESSGVVGDDVEEKIVELSEIADELQGSLFDLLENV